MRSFYEPAAKDAALAAAIDQHLPDVLVVRSAKVNESALNAGALKLVVRAGAGYNTIDVAAGPSEEFTYRIARKEFGRRGRAGVCADPCD